MPHASTRHDTGNDSAFISGVGDVPPAKEPAVAPLVGKAGIDFISRDPIARESESLGVGLFGGRQVAGVEAIVGGPAVVEVMEQLGFVQGQIHVIAPAEDVAATGGVQSKSRSIDAKFRVQFQERLVDAA